MGVISDTHGLTRSEVFEFLKSCDLIIHAGDIVNDSIIYELEQICKVEAVRGNNDYMSPVNMYPDFKEIIINGNIKIYVIHDLHYMKEDISKYDIVIHGHTHSPSKEYNGNTLILNPGSFGPKRFSLPISLATIDFTKDNIVVNFHQL